jgi:hypothetical protein
MTTAWTPETHIEHNYGAVQDRLRTEHDIWFPGDQLHDPLASPTPEEFRATFAASVRPDAEVVSIDGALSAMAVPERPVGGYLMIDLHDTVADLGGSLQLLQYTEVTPVHKRTNAHDYGNSSPDRAMFFTDEERALKGQLYALIHASEAGLLPVEDLDAITDIITQLREKDIYTGFITSVTKGSEIPVINNFVGKYFKNNCDFVVVPVIPEGKDYKSADKGQTAKHIIERFTHLHGAPAIAIDDLPANTAKFRHALEEVDPPLAVETIQIRIPSDREPDDGSYHALDSLDAFRHAQQRITQCLGKFGISGIAVSTQERRVRS